MTNLHKRNTIQVYKEILLMTVVQGRFEWDSEKNEINVQKHGFSFEEVLYVFNDHFAIESIDRENSSLEETRYKLIGRIKTQIILFVRRV